MAESARILLICNVRSSHNRNVIEGAWGYCQTKGWEMVHEHEPEITRSLAEEMGVQGLIVHSTLSVAIHRSIADLRLPFVSTLCDDDAPFPIVSIDNVAVGRLAAEHLIERGLRHFAFLGENWGSFSARRDGFTRALAAHGLDCHVCPHPLPRIGPGQERVLPLVIEWVMALPRPCGVFVCNDRYGVRLVNSLRMRGVSIPHELAFVGAQNDELACRLTGVSLSSVEVNGREMGRRAGEILSALMAGRSAPMRLVVPPIGVVARQSTDTLAIDDADVAEALRFIRARAHQGIAVQDVLEVVGISRRLLETRFTRLLGHGPGEEIRRCQLNRARQLLRETDLPIPQVARMSGLRRREHLSNLLRRYDNTTPAALRRRRQRTTLLGE